MQSANDLIKTFSGLDEIAVLGNGVSILDTDIEAFQDIFTIGVNNICIWFIPDILFWHSRDPKRVQLFLDPLGKVKKYPLLACSSRAYNLGAAIEFPVDVEDKICFGNEYQGKIVHNQAYLQAMHLGMILAKKMYLVGCDFSDPHHFFWYMGYQDPIYEDQKYNYEINVKSMIDYCKILKEKNKTCKIVQTCKGKLPFPYENRFNIAH